MLKSWDTQEHPICADDGAVSDTFVFRTMNVSAAALLMVLTLPLLLLAMLAVRLTSKGPVIHREQRVGPDRRARLHACRERRDDDLGGRPFTLYSLRTVRVDAPPVARTPWARATPPLTAVGRVLEATRLHALPQLYNVLRGDMPLIGPRPRVPRRRRTMGPRRAPMSVGG